MPLLLIRVPANQEANYSKTDTWSGRETDAMVSFT
jgi:hypothetical protein